MTSSPKFREYDLVYCGGRTGHIAGYETLNDIHTYTIEWSDYYSAHTEKEILDWGNLPEDRDIVLHDVSFCANLEDGTPAIRIRFLQSHDLKTLNIPLKGNRTHLERDIIREIVAARKWASIYANVQEKSDSSSEE